MRDVKLLLEGRPTDLLRSLRQRMEQAASTEEYERAAKYRDLISTVDQLQEKQRIAAVEGDDADVFGYHYENGMLAVNLFHMRGGRVLDRREFFWEELPELAAVENSGVNEASDASPMLPAETLPATSLRGSQGASPRHLRSPRNTAPAICPIGNEHCLVAIRHEIRSLIAPFWGRFVPIAAATYLDTLNSAQRRAVEHGIGPDGHIGPPLLVIAGAGSGKTNTLAHRVAHLIVHGADPRRILLMTFSRRAAAEMARRVELIARKTIGSDSGPVRDALAWAGTFHGIGSRLLREYAEQIGLNPAFTIHDREDSADLLNLIRHERGLSKTKSRFPAKGTCLAIYSRCVNAETELQEVLERSFPWCSAGRPN